MKELSCGIIIINSDNKILACRAYGKKEPMRCYDIPKGKINEGESTYDAAIRETNEEIGLDLSYLNIIDLGHFVYNSKKNLHLYKCRLDIPDLTVLHCDSTFEDNFGNIVPEMVGYKWVDLYEIDTTFYKSLANVLNKIDLCK